MARAAIPFNRIRVLPGRVEYPTRHAAPVIFIQKPNEIDVFRQMASATIRIFVVPNVSLKRLKTETGLSIPTLRDACRRAGVPEDAGCYDRDLALAAVRAQVDPARVAGHAVSGLGNVPIANTYADARARSETARAEKLELETLVRRGELVERAAVTASCTEIVVRVRTALLGIGTRAAPLVLGKTDLLETINTINAAARQVLGELADDQSLNDAVLNG